MLTYEDENYFWWVLSIVIIFALIS